MKTVNFRGVPIRIHVRGDGYWYSIGDITKSLDYSMDNLIYRLSSEEKECYMKRIEADTYYTTLYISHEGLETICYRNDNDECYELRDWIKDIHKKPIRSRIVEKINTLMRLEKVKELCEYFDIDPKDERICSLVNVILDELE